MSRPRNSNNRHFTAPKPLPGDLGSWQHMEFVGWDMWRVNRDYSSVCKRSALRSKRSPVTYEADKHSCILHAHQLMYGLDYNSILISIFCPPFSSQSVGRSLPQTGRTLRYMIGIGFAVVHRVRRYDQPVFTPLRHQLNFYTPESLAYFMAGTGRQCNDPWLEIRCSSG